MKQLLNAAVVLLGGAFCFGAPALSHGGGLDANGCHTNRKTSEYHCHKGRKAPSSQTQTVQLISVGDGDTIRVRTRDGEKLTIRLACIDAPETAQGVSGKQATEALKYKLRTGSLTLKTQTIDRYGRTVAELYVGTTNVNLAMVRDGYAYAYRQYLSKCDRNAYLNAETAAQSSRLGVWGLSGQVKPWDWRRGKR